MEREALRGGVEESGVMWEAVEEGIKDCMKVVVEAAAAYVSVGISL